MDILISNLLSKSIFDSGKWSNWKYANTCNCVFSVWPLFYFKKSKMDFPLYFQKVMLLWQGLIVEIDYGFFWVFGPYFIGKSLGTFKILIFWLWSFISHPYLYRSQWDFCILEYGLFLILSLVTHHKYPKDPWIAPYQKVNHLMPYHKTWIKLISKKLMPYDTVWDWMQMWRTQRHKKV